MNKYHNQSVIVDGIKFPSKKEAYRYKELSMLQKAGIIKNLRLQVAFELIPKQDGEQACKYIADFVYEQDGKVIVEDTKGIKTEVYKIKRKLMLFVHGIKVQEV